MIHNRTPLRYGLLSIGLALLTAWYFRPGAAVDSAAMVLWVLGGVLLADVLFQLRGVGVRRLSSDSVPGAQAPLNQTWLGLGIWALLFLALRSGVESGPLTRWMTIHVQFLLLIFGITALVYGVFGRVSRRGVVDFWRQHRQEIGIVLAVSFVALVIRLWDLLAVYAPMDEGPFILGVNEIRENATLSLSGMFFNDTFFTRLYPYLQMLFSAVFGSSLLTMRLTSVMFGTLTIPALYLLARWLFDRPTALIAAAFLAVFPPHIHFSRIAYNNIADPFFGVLALAFFTRALQTGHRGYYVASGVALGLLFYFYEGGQLVFPLLLIAWLVWMVLVLRIRPSLRGLLWLGLGAGLMVLPIAAARFAQEQPLLPRIQERNVSEIYQEEIDELTFPTWLQDVYLPDRLGLALSHYFRTPDTSNFYGGDTPLVLPWLMPLLSLGFFHCLWRPRGGGVLILGWLLLNAIGNSMIVHVNWSARFVVTFPALVLLLAVGLRYTVPLIFTGRVQRWVLAGMTLVLMVPQVLYYFEDHLPFYYAQIGYFLGHYDAIDRMRDLPPETQVYYIPMDYLQARIAGYLMLYTDMPIRDNVHSIEDGDLPGLDEIDPSLDYAFFLPPGNEHLVREIAYYWHFRGPYVSESEKVPWYFDYSLYLAPAEGWRGRGETVNEADAE